MTSFNWDSGGGGGGGSSDITPGVTPVVGGTPYMVLDVDAGGFVDQTSQLLDATGTLSVDFWGHLTADSSGLQSIDYDGRIAVDNTGARSVDWQGRLLQDTGSGTVVDYGNQILYPSGSSLRSVDWGDRALYDGNNELSADWNNHALSDGTVFSVDYSGRVLLDNGSAPAVDWQNRFLIDLNILNSIDWQNRLAYAADGTTPTIDYGNAVLNDTSEIQSVNWGARTLVNGTGGDSVVWGLWRLVDSSNKIAFSWNARDLYNTGPNPILNWSDNIVITQYSGQSTPLLLINNSIGGQVFAVSTVGAVVGASFTGAGSGLTSLSASNISSGTLPVARGGTNNGGLVVTAGSVFYADGSKFVSLAPGTSGQALLSNGASAPTWGAQQTFTHISGSGTAPSIVAGVGSGTSPTVSLTGHDLAGAVTITTGSLPTGTNAVVATVTFNAAYTSAPYIVLQPANAITATLSGVSMVYVTSTTTTFVITSGTTGLTASTTYLWNYHVIQ